MNSRQEDYYLRLREKIKSWIKKSQGPDSRLAEYLLFAPDMFHLLCKLSVDPEVPVSEKSKIAAALAYFISPIDILPELILGPIGFTDDIALAAYVLNSLINNTHPDIVKKHWAGEIDILIVIQKILKSADNMVGGGLWKKVKNKINL